MSFNDCVMILGLYEGTCTGKSILGFEFSSSSGTSVVNLNYGLYDSLYDYGWYESLNKVICSERVFNTPMYDSTLKRWCATKKNGWFGENVCKEGIFGDVSGEIYCLWLNSYYPGKYVIFEER